MAQIIEHATGDVAAVDVDVVTLDIIENALRNARYEMDAVLFRTAMSPGIREQHDEFPLIADRKGRMVVDSLARSSAASCAPMRATSKPATSSWCLILTNAKARSAMPTTGWVCC